MEVLILFMYALLLGSFYNVVGLRIPKGMSIVTPRSHCTSCKTTLTGIDLIPVLSYLFSKGKCRYCSTNVSPIYPFFELLTAILFVLAPIFMGWSYELIFVWTYLSMLIIITITDIHYMIIPNKILLFFFSLFVIQSLFLNILPLHEQLIGLAVGFLLPFLIAVVSKGGMGGGDVKLLAVIGFVVGWQQLLLIFFLSSLIGTIIALIGMKLGKVQKGKPFPFGPFIAISAVITLFFGENLLNWYITLLT
ncbi:prepilin peptidase [Bacillus alkalisoli]|uniref:prepilin peptidase n=1 Tax=Bacillus alkalisoli TaxID=2011008 RepID=UPI000C241792|nr:A24 family peptidase [Bacillus alkalisoli]